MFTRYHMEHHQYQVSLSILVMSSSSSSFFLNLVHLILSIIIILITMYDNIISYNIIGCRWSRRRCSHYLRGRLLYKQCKESPVGILSAIVLCNSSSLLEAKEAWSVGSHQLV